MNKADLRLLYKEKRNLLTVEQINVYQKEIYKQVKQIDFSLIFNVHIFLPIEKFKEIDTYPIINYLWSIGVNTVISRSNFKENSLSHFLYNVNTSLVINKWGIPEPINAVEFPLTNIDLVFVPLLISDKQNYRVGYGKGFYDRFLSQCKSDVKTIGLNYFEPIERIAEINNFDVALDNVISGEYYKK